jgi:hypothetical protein
LVGQATGEIEPQVRLRRQFRQSFHQRFRVEVTDGSDPQPPPARLKLRIVHDVTRTTDGKKGEDDGPTDLLCILANPEGNPNRPTLSNLGESPYDGLLIWPLPK